MVYSYYNYITIFAKIFSVICNTFDSRTVGVSATMEPYHNRLLCISIQILCPNIQILAVFALCPVTMRNQEISAIRICHICNRSCRTIDKTIAHIVPCIRSLRLFKSVGFCIRNPTESISSVVNKTTNLSVCGICNALCFADYNTFCS